MAPVSALLTDSMTLLDRAFLTSLRAAATNVDAGAAGLDKRQTFDNMRLTASEAFSNPSQCWNYWGCKVVIIVGAVLALLVACKSPTYPRPFSIASVAANTDAYRTGQPLTSPATVCLLSCISSCIWNCLNCLTCGILDRVLCCACNRRSRRHRSRSTDGYSSRGISDKMLQRNNIAYANPTYQPVAIRPDNHPQAYAYTPARGAQYPPAATYVQQTGTVRS